MKLISKAGYLLLAGAMAFGLAACSSDTSSSSSTNTDTSTEESAAVITTTNSSNLNDILNDAKLAFENQGCGVDQVEKDDDEAEFKATSQSGVMEITIDQYASADEAKREFLDDNNSIEEEGFEAGNSYVSGSKSLSVFYNDTNSLYEVTAMDETTKVVYEIDNIPDDGLDLVLAAMKALGYPTE